MIGLWGISNGVNLLSLGVIQYNSNCETWNGEIQPEAPDDTDVPFLIETVPLLNTTIVEKQPAINETVVPVLNITKIVLGKRPAINDIVSHSVLNDTIPVLDITKIVGPRPTSIR